jgi:hypothetical protein
VISSILLLCQVLLLLCVTLDVVSLTYFPVDTILGILLGESYSGIRALTDLSVCVKHTNKLSGTVAEKS